MDGRAFLSSGQALLAIPTEANWRSAAGRAYYALLHECQSTLLRWGIPKPAGEQLHQFIRTRFGYNVHPDIRPVGLALDRLSRLRNEADYQLSTMGSFADAAPATLAIQMATARIDLLDAIDADPARQADVVAALQSRWP